jgi:Protein of unknown function (DUF4238)
MDGPSLRASPVERDSRRKWYRLVMPEGIGDKMSPLFDSARKNAEGSRPRKHHLIPASYLRRWAESGMVRVTELNQRRTYTVAPEKAARETDFYSLEHESLDPDEIPPLLMEALLSEVEGAAAAATDRLIAKGADSLTKDERFAMTSHLALQLTRGRSYREENRHMLADGYRLLYAEYSDADIRRHLESRGIEVTPDVLDRHKKFPTDLQSGKVEIGRHRAQEVALAAQTAQDVGVHLWTRHWRVYRTPAVLITCDEPVVAVEGRVLRGANEVVSSAQGSLSIHCHRHTCSPSFGPTSGANGMRTNSTMPRRRRCIVSSWLRRTAGLSSAQVGTLLSGCPFRLRRRNLSCERGRCRNRQALRVTCTATSSLLVGGDTPRSRPGRLNAGGRQSPAWRTFG